MIDELYVLFIEDSSVEGQVPRVLEFANKSEPNEEGGCAIRPVAVADARTGKPLSLESVVHLQGQWAKALSLCEWVAEHLEDNTAIFTRSGDLNGTCDDTPA